MNFLAHCFLSGSDEHCLVGNFLGDYIGNRPLEQYASGIREGVLLHRRIDAYTDAHPQVLQGVRRLYPYHHKYSSVVVDIFYDFLLAYNWDSYSDQSLGAYTQGVYKTLLEHIEIMPARLQKNLPLMVADDWLRNYGSREGLEHTFRRLQARVSKPEDLSNALESLDRDFAMLNDEFNHFFPDIIEFVNRESKTDTDGPEKS